MKHYRNFEVPKDSKVFSKWFKWKRKMLGHKAVKPTRSRKNELINFYKKYANGTIRNEHYDLYYDSDKPKWLTKDK